MEILTIISDIVISVSFLVFWYIMLSKLSNHIEGLVTKEEEEHL